MFHSTKDSLIKTAILAGFLIFLCRLIYTNEIIFYIHPRFVPFTKVTCVILFIMLLLPCRKWRWTGSVPTDNHPVHNNYINYFPFLFTLLLAFILPNSELNASMVNNRGLNSSLTNHSRNEDYRKELQQASFIKVTENNYLGVLRELTYHPEEYTGKNIEIKGFACKNSYESPDGISIVRYIVGCCAADAYPYGLLCQIQEPDTIVEGAWYEVQGTIQTVQTNNKSTPIINVTWMKPISRPACPYIFPY